MLYKAIFDIPNDLTPPVTVGFQVAMAVQTEQGVQIQPKIYTAVLMPIKSPLEEWEDLNDASNN